MKRLLLLSLLASASVPVSIAQPGGPQKEVAYRNISFLLDPALAKDYAAETVPAFRLEVKTDTPEGVAPEHLLIRLRDSYVPRGRSRSGNDEAVPEITLYPIADGGDKKFNGGLSRGAEVRGGAEGLSLRRSHPAGEPVPFLPGGT